MFLRSMTFGLLVGTLYATLSIGHDVHIHSMIAAEQRSAFAPVAPIPAPVAGPRIVDITAAAAADRKVIEAAIGLLPGEAIVGVNDLRIPYEYAKEVVPAFEVLATTPGTYLDLTVRRPDTREDRILVLVH
jgi:hypothetical protein